MTHGADADVARAAPGIDERAQRILVGQRQLGLEHVEARRERELRASVARRAARQLRLDRRACAGPTSPANRTAQSRAPSTRRPRWPPRACGTARVRTVPGCSSPSRAVTTPSAALTTISPAPIFWVFGIGDRDAVDCRAARNVFEAVRQHDEHARVAGRNAVHADHRFVASQAFVVRIWRSAKNGIRISRRRVGAAFWRNTKSLRHNVPGRSSANCE